MINQPESDNIYTVKTQLKTIGEIKPKYYKASGIIKYVLIEEDLQDKICKRVIV